MAEKPTGAFVLSLIGGIFLILGAMIWFVVGALFSFFPTLGLGFATLGTIGLVLALIVIVGGVMMFMKPEQHTAWGAIILILSFVSIPFTFAGVIIGFILTLVGGILGLVFKPTPMMPTAAYAPPPMAPPPQ